MVRVPPCFCAKAGGDAANASNNGPAVANPQRLRFIPSASCSVSGPKTRHFRLAGRYPSFVQDGDPRAYHLPDNRNRGQHRRSIAVLLVRLGRKRLFVGPEGQCLPFGCPGKGDNTATSRTCANNPITAC